MAQQHEEPPADRLLALLDHLGLGTVHMAAQIPGEIAKLAQHHPGRLGGIVLCAAPRLDPAPFAGVADRILLIAGEHGMTAEAAQRAAARLAGAEKRILAGYEPAGWSDVVADHAAEIAAAMIAFLGRHRADRPRAPAREGAHAGITYHIEGAGPALLLLPFFLARSQWLPALPHLARHFTVATLGGGHLGGVAMLEDRARAPSYRAMFRTLIDAMKPAPGEPILEVGCGAGSLVRQLAGRLGGANPITGLDTNPFLLREAAALARDDAVDGQIRFAEGNAEALPFEDGAFGCAYSVTVFEECDADRAIAEMVRVTRPGGRIGIAVRAIDMPQWWNLDLPESIRRKIEAPPRSVSPGGVADASLYRRLRRAGLDELVCFPYLVTLDRPEGPIWRWREDAVVPLLTPAQAAIWRQRREEALGDGLLFMAHPLHCAVATKAPPT
ncbi:MAG: methyltransferase domain-containing protein [Alphaproteobacteria bacterium]|nr:methyltransferase domain-containing protein [Alphaproteobacteria bacterium]